MAFCVDKALCTHCGGCVADCVCGIISQPEQGLPFIDGPLKDVCVHCGHCAAVCPAGAITLDGHSPSSLATAHGGIEENSLASLFKGRRAIRNFTPETVDRRLLEKALSFANYAPTAHNAREVAYLVLNGRERVETLLREGVALLEEQGMYPKLTAQFRNGRDLLFREAYCLILIHAPERILSETDCATAAAYLELALHGLGLGSCWAGMLLEACTQKIPPSIDLPAGNRLYAALMVGKPTPQYLRIPARNSPVVQWA